VCVRGALATGGRALPERLVAVGPWTHHRSIINIKMGWWVGEF
jgi:hypothetical protein